MKTNQRQLSLAHSLTLLLARSLTHSLRRCVYNLPDSFSCQHEWAIRYSTNTYLICDIWYVTLHLRDQRDAASLRYRIWAEFTVPMCEQKPCMVSRRRNSYPVQCDWNSLKKTVLDGRQYSWPDRVGHRASIPVFQFDILTMLIVNIIGDELLLNFGAKFQR